MCVKSAVRRPSNKLHVVGLFVSSSDALMAAIPITVFTGFLGAGKTSIIISILARLPQNYNIVLLKNEFGDVQVDSKLAQQSSLTAVSEILNGCM